MSADEAEVFVPRPGGIQSVARAARILLKIASSGIGQTAKEVAEFHGLTLPTSYNLLSTLCDEGLLDKGPEHRYVVGPGAALVAEAVYRSTEPRQHYLALLNQLAEATEETVYLSAWRGDRIVLQASVEGRHALRVAELRPGFSDHMHARSSAKLLIALAPEPLRSRVVDSLDFERYTPSTITDRASFEAELDRIALTGMAYDHEEHLADVVGVSIGIEDHGLVSAVLSVAAPAQRFARNRHNIEEAARRVAGRLGP